MTEPAADPAVFAMLQLQLGLSVPLHLLLDLDE